MPDVTTRRTIAITTTDDAATRALAARLARALRPGDVIALDGPLGAGKTCFVRGLAAGLGIDPAEVSSPTFLLCHEYRGAGERRLHHLDAYRLGGPEDLEGLGWDEMLADGDAIVAVEWSARVAGRLPDDRIDVTIDHVDPETRAVTIVAHGDRIDRLEGLTTDTTHRCPMCREPVTRDAETFPFCSARCRMADLGQWLGGRYRIARPLGPDDLEE